MSKTNSTRRTRVPRTLDALALPSNPLIDGVPAETLDRVMALQTWLYWHPLHTPEGNHAAHVELELRVADGLIHKLVKDALRYESERRQAG
jgi:hypothetical protein